MDIGKVHIKFFVNKEYWAARYLHHTPRVGEEVRFNADEFYTVKRLAWPMDEEDSPYERCNVELVKAI